MRILGTKFSYTSDESNYLAEYLQLRQAEQHLEQKYAQLNQANFSRKLAGNFLYNLFVLCYPAIKNAVSKGFDPKAIKEGWDLKALEDYEKWVKNANPKTPEEKKAIEWIQTKEPDILAKIKKFNPVFSMKREIADMAAKEPIFRNVSLQEDAMQQAFENAMLRPKRPLKSQTDRITFKSPVIEMYYESLVDFFKEHGEVKTVERPVKDPVTHKVVHDAVGNPVIKPVVLKPRIFDEFIRSRFKAEVNNALRNLRNTVSRDVPMGEGIVDNSSEGTSDPQTKIFLRLLQNKVIQDWHADSSIWGKIDTIIDQHTLTPRDPKNKHFVEAPAKINLNARYKRLIDFIATFEGYKPQVEKDPETKQPIIDPETGKPKLRYGLTDTDLSQGVAGIYQGTGSKDFLDDMATEAVRQDIFKGLPIYNQQNRRSTNVYTVKNMIANLAEWLAPIFHAAKMQPKWKPMKKVDTKPIESEEISEKVIPERNYPEFKEPIGGFMPQTKGGRIKFSSIFEDAEEEVPEY